MANIKIFEVEKLNNDVSAVLVVSLWVPLCQGILNKFNYTTVFYLLYKASCYYSVLYVSLVHTSIAALNKKITSYCSCLSGYICLRSNQFKQTIITSPPLLCKISFHYSSFVLLLEAHRYIALPLLSLFSLFILKNYT